MSEKRAFRSPEKLFCDLSSVRTITCGSFFATEPAHEEVSSSERVGANKRAESPKARQTHSSGHLLLVSYMESELRFIMQF